MSVHVEVLRSPDELEPLACKLRDRAPTPFHSPEWQFTWWRHFGSGDLLALALYKGESLVGFLPSFLHDWQGQRQLTLLGTGITDYLEPFLDPGCVRNAIDEVCRFDWQVCNWQDLPAGSALLNRDFWKEAHIAIEADVPVSAILITSSFGDFLAARSKDLRRNLRRYRDRAEESGPLAFRVLEFADEETVEELIALHGGRWRKRGEEGTIEVNHAGRFLREVSHQMAAIGALRLFELRWKRAIAAVSLGFLWRGRLYSYLSAFRPENEILGFGRILLHDSLAYAWSSGYSAWDFLRGEESYKASWGAIPQERSRLIIRR